MRDHRMITAHRSITLFSEILINVGLRYNQCILRTSTNLIALSRQTTMACQITSLTIVYLTVYSGAAQRKHQSSPSLAFVWGMFKMANNAENVSIWWRHHGFWMSSWVCFMIWPRQLIYPFFSACITTCPRLHHQMETFSALWLFVRGIHLMFSLICAWINGWVNNRETGDLRLFSCLGHEQHSCLGAHQ